MNRDPTIMNYATPRGKQAPAVTAGWLTSAILLILLGTMLAAELLPPKHNLALLSVLIASVAGVIWILVLLVWGASRLHKTRKLSSALPFLGWAALVGLFCSISLPAVVLAYREVAAIRKMTEKPDGMFER